MSVEGILGRKLGMTQIFESDGTAVPVTVIETAPVTVVQVKTLKTDGYEAVQVGIGTRKRVNSPQKGHMKSLGQFQYLRELKVTTPGWEVGKTIGSDLRGRRPGDVTGVTMACSLA
jgi:large subunit ribosomal protein L3